MKEIKKMASDWRQQLAEKFDKLAKTAGANGHETPKAAPAPVTAPKAAEPPATPAKAEPTHVITVKAPLHVMSHDDPRKLLPNGPPPTRPDECSACHTKGNPTKHANLGDCVRALRARLYKATGAPEYK